MSEILYNFGANHSSLEDVNSQLKAIEEVRQDIDSIFTTLMSVYEGEGATSLNQAHVHLSSMLDEAINNTANTQKQAQEQQEVMQALDRANAAAF
jgi:flagellar hook-basal body complex protein FliE